VLAVFVSAKEKPNGQFNRTHAFDTGTAWGYLGLEALRKGLIVHGMGGFDPEKAKEILNVPENYEVHAVVAIGYQGDKNDLPDQFQEREKPSNRRPLTESVFEGGFGLSIR
jgi:nitroreductase